MRTSYSALQTFQNCPQKYKFQVIDRIKVPKSKEAVFGTLIHKTLKFLHLPQLLCPTLEDVLNFYNQNWNSEVFENKNEEVAAMKQGIDILTRYYNNNDIRSANIVNLETRFEVPVGQHLLAGIIDRIDRLEDGSFEIIDYKTTSRLPAQQIVDNDFQLSLYSLGLTGKWPKLEIPQVKLSLYFLKHGVKLTSQRTPKQLEETKHHVLALISEIEKSDFKPIPSALCNWCGYQKYCPMFRHKFRQEQISDEEIEEILKEFFEIKARSQEGAKRLTELREKIFAYCDKEGVERIFSDQGFITRLAQERYKYNPDKLRRILEPLGKWNDVLAIDSSKLKKVALSLPTEVRREISKARVLDKEYKMLKITPAKKNSKYEIPNIK